MLFEGQNVYVSVPLQLVLLRWFMEAGVCK